jgi:hypothetical protein
MIPEIVFVVPYRDRAPHKKVFESIMPTILEDENYKILFIHQKDKRSFNRGAMRNIGFLNIKETYPDDYKNITIVFHDIDIMPYYKNQFDYKTTPNIVKHFYGYTWALGGIVSINAEDFEKINGYPNIWTWGLEDNILQKRCIQSGYSVDRSQFMSYGNNDNQLIILSHGWDRLIDVKIKQKLDTNETTDGISIIKKITKTTEPINKDISVVNVQGFLTGENSRVASRLAKMIDSRQNNKFITKHIPSIAKRVSTRFVATRANNIAVANIAVANIAVANIAVANNPLSAMLTKGLKTTQDDRRTPKRNIMPIRFM